MAAQALRDLQEVAKGPSRPVIYQPPEMVPQWQPAYAQQLKKAIASALDAGVSACKIFKLLDSIATVDLDAVPDDLLAPCVEAGLGPDTNMGDESLLHYLINAHFPVPLGQVVSTSSTNHSDISSSAGAAAAKQQPFEHLDEDQAASWQRLQDLQRTIPAQHHPACGTVTLAELLRQGATPDLPDESGNTALHMVVACMVSKKHFPDSTVQGRGSTLQGPQSDGGDSQSADNSSTAAEAAAEPRQLDDHDAARAAYAAAAFLALLRAGWNPAIRNSNGYSVSDLVLEGLSRYQTELSDLQDPEGVAQTTVALLSKKAPDKGLQQYLDAKIEGVQAVVDALLLMHQLAATAEAPRKRRSAISLVLMWLVLLLACVWWIYGRR